jgi:hypothetical protein
LLAALTAGPAIVLANALVFGPAVGLVGGLVGGLVRGLSTNQLDEHIRLRTNQGIWRSAGNGLAYGVVGGLTVGLVGGLVIGLATVLANALVGQLANALAFGLFFGLIGLIVGLGVGLLGGLGVGGLGAFLRHFTLRFWLWRADSFPWNLVPFLDEAAERLLLRKVGGGYIFVHRLLLEYFASLDSPPTLDEARAQKQQDLPIS